LICSAIEARDLLTGRLGGDRTGSEPEAIDQRLDALDAGGRAQEAREAWQQALDILDDLHHPDAEDVRAKAEMRLRGG
jgi:hypothetical protein